MALSAAQVWEVRTTGSDSNGGAFKAGASGTDYSQQDAAQVAYTDLAIDATTNTKLTSAANPFTSAHVGNVLNVVGGTGFTTGRYEVTSVAANVATMDRAVGTSSSTGGTGNLGGALLTLGTLASSMVASNKAWIKGGTYGTTAALTFTQSVATPSFNTPPTQLIGYATARGDITPSSANQSSRPLIQVNSAQSNVLALTGGGWRVSNIQIGLGTGSITSGFVNNGQNHSTFANCKVSGYGSAAGVGLFISGNNAVAIQCEATGGVSGATSGIQLGSGSKASHCTVHDTNGLGIGLGSSATGEVSHCLVYNCAGASADGIQVSAFTHACWNTVYNCGRHGINMTAPDWSNTVLGNLLANNGGYGLANTAGAGVPATTSWDGNAFYGNASGTRNNLDDTSVNACDGVSPYSNSRDVTLTASPFVNAGSADFRLNSTAGGGATARAVAPLNNLPGLTILGYRDFGALQHQDSGVTVITSSFLEG